MAKKKTSETVIEKEVYCYDLEQFQNFHSASFKNIKTGQRRTFTIYYDLRDSKLSINHMPELIKFIEEEVKTLIGYNNHEYDDLMLKHMFINKDMFLTGNTSVKDMVDSLKRLNDRIINMQKLEKITGKKDMYIRNLKSQRKFSSIDLMKLFNTVDKVSLKQLAINLRWPNIIDLPFPPDHIVVREQIPIILEYNENDVDITERVLKEKEPDLKFRKDFGKLYDINIINSNDTNVAKAVIRKFYCQYAGIKYEDFKDKRTFYKRIDLRTCISPRVRFMTAHYQHLLNTIRNKDIDPLKLKDREETEEELKRRAEAESRGKKVKKPKEEKQFEYILKTKYLTHTIGLGGIHSINPPEELIETNEFEYIDADATAFYPYIMVTCQQFPKHLGLPFIKAYDEYIVQNRVNVKALWKAGIDYAVNKLIDDGLKISANSTYGLTKSMFSWMYDPHVTTYVCITGQLYLSMLIERLEELTDCIVVYSNTDGITTRVPKYAKDDYFRICRQWTEALKIDLEFVNYKRMLLKDINNYMMITANKDKPVKQVGLFLVKKKLKQAYVYPIIAKALQEYYEKGVPVDKTIKSCTDVFDFMKAERTSESKFHIYIWPRHMADDDKPTKLQKSNRWIVTDGCKDEGRIIKYSRKAVDAQGQPEATNMQKGYWLTVVNDVRPYMDVTKLHLNYDFYITECMKIIKSIKFKGLDTHNHNFKQGHLF
jgi:hypothetical protein